MNPRSWCPAPLRLLALLALSLLLAPAAHAGLLTADSTYREYRIPERRWSSWTASLDAGGSHSFDSSPFGTSGDRRGSVSGHLGTNATQGYDSDRLYHRWGAGFDLTGGRNGRTLDQVIPGFSSHDEQSNRGVSESMSLDGAIRVYPWSAPLGLTGSSTLDLSLGQNFSSLDRVEHNPPSERRSTSSNADRQRIYRGTLGAGVGWGRVRDATPVFQAQVLESRLRKTGALMRELSDAARAKLAALFTTQFSVGFAHQRPDKYFWREIERILDEDGALGPRSLDPFDVFRILEPLSVAGNVPRRSGYFVGPMISVSTNQFRDAFESSSSSVTFVADTVVATFRTSFENTREDRRDDVFTSFGAQFNRPLSERWQLDAGTNLALSEAGELLTTFSTIQTSWIVSDRWLAIVRFNHNGRAPGHGTDRQIRLWSVGLNGELDYFLEDSWALRLSASEGQSHSGAFFDRSGSFQLGVTYVVSGLFEAPGLVPAMRPTPPTP